jgi:uncharacterized repeat protein (TIGR01451 family)
MSVWREFSTVGRRLPSKLILIVLSLGLGLGLAATVVLGLSTVHSMSRAASVEPYLVKDILTGPDGQNLDELVNVNGTVFFAASDGASGNAHGEELWKSDGTPTGTVMVKDIYMGTSGSNLSRLTNVNGTLFFRATEGSHGVELWKSDGTPTGTVMVKDIRAGAGNSWPLELADMGGVLFFCAGDSSHNSELWKSDGTPTGTVMVKDIAPGLFSSSPKQFTDVDGMVFFQATDGWTGNAHGTELWKSDGTPTGTVMVKDIHSGITSSLPFYLAAMDGTLFFRANDGSHGVELWKSDGTPTGTLMVKDIYTGASDSSPSQLTNVNGTLFFQATDGVHGKELWKSDGTPTGTLMVTDIYPGIPDAEPSDLTALSGVLFFRAADGWVGNAHGAELWKSDGTPTGTIMVKDIYSGAGFSFPYELTAVGDTLLFVAADGSHGYELWKSDGTLTGTVMAKDIYCGTDSSSPDRLTGVDGVLFFQANDGSHGAELWALAVAPSLNVDKTVEGVGGSAVRLPLGGVVTYTIVLGNSGGSIASGVTMTDRLPRGVSFGGWVQRDAATLKFPPAGETIQWGPQDIAADTQVAIRFTATITTSQSFVVETITNTARFTSTNAGSGSDDAVFTVEDLNFLYMPIVFKDY